MKNKSSEGLILSVRPISRFVLLLFSFCSFGWAGRSTWRWGGYSCAARAKGGWGVVMHESKMFTITLYLPMKIRIYRHSRMTNPYKKLAKTGACASCLCTGVKSRASDEGLRGPPPCHTYTYMYYYTEVIFTFGNTAYIYMKTHKMVGIKLNGYDML